MLHFPTHSRCSPTSVAFLPSLACRWRTGSITFWRGAVWALWRCCVWTERSLALSGCSMNWNCTWIRTSKLLSSSDSPGLQAHDIAIVTGMRMILTRHYQLLLYRVVAVGRASRQIISKTLCWWLTGWVRRTTCQMSFWISEWGPTRQSGFAQAWNLRSFSLAQPSLADSSPICQIITVYLWPDTTGGFYREIQPNSGSCMMDCEQGSLSTSKVIFCSTGRMRLTQSRLAKGLYSRCGSLAAVTSIKNRYPYLFSIRHYSNKRHHE